MAYVLNKTEKNWVIENGSGIKIVIENLHDVGKAVMMLSFEAPKLAAVKKEGNRREQVSAALSTEPQTARQIMEKIGGVKKEEQKYYASILSILASAKKIKRKKNSDGIFEYFAK